MSTKITDHMLKGTSIRTLLQRAAAEVGFNLVDGSFEEGAVVTESNDVVWFRNEGTYYGWGGTIPVGGYIVPAGSTPATSGGIGAGAWVDRTDLTLRSELAGFSGTNLVGFSHDILYSPETVGFRLKNTVYATDTPFNAPTDGSDASSHVNAALVYCQVNKKTLVLNGIFKVTDTIQIPSEVKVVCLNSDCGLYSEVPAGKYAVDFVGDNSSFIGGVVYGQNLPASLAVRQDGVRFSATSSNCTLQGTHVYGFFAKGLPSSNADGVGIGVNDLGVGNRIDKCKISGKFCVNLSGKNGYVTNSVISNGYLSSSEPKPWNDTSNYWDGICGENMRGYLVEGNVVYENGQSGIYTGGNNGYSFDNIIKGNRVFNNWNRGIDMGLSTPKSSINDVFRITIVDNSVYNNRENNIWLAGITAANVGNNISWFDSNYDAIFAGSPGGHICISLGSGNSPADVCNNCIIDGNICIDDKGRAGIILASGSVNNVIGSSNNLSGASSIYVGDDATAAANTINLGYRKYFSPILKPDSGSVTVGTSSGQLTFVGKRVYISATVTLSAISSPGGGLNIAYLPGLSGKTILMGSLHVSYWQNLTLTSGVVPIAKVNTSNSDQISIAKPDGGRLLFNVADILTATSTIQVDGFIEIV